MYQSQNSTEYQSQNSTVHQSQNSPVYQSQNSPVYQSQNCTVYQSQNSPVNQSQNSPVNRSQNSPVGWLVVLRIYVALAVFQPYRDLEAGGNQSLKFKSGNQTRTSCSASQDLLKPLDNCRYQNSSVNQSQN